MTSLEFTSLPLNEVRLMLRPAESKISLPIQILVQVQASMRADFPILQHFMCETGPGVAFELYAGPGPGLVAASEDGAMSCSLLAGAAEVKWRRVGVSSYPGFGPLYEFLGRLVNQVTPSLDISTIVYVNVVECDEGETLDDYFTLPSTVPSDNLKELNISQVVERNGGGYEFRIQTGRASATSWVFTTSCGTREDKMALNDLIEVHDVCNEMFLSLLTDHAKKKFGHKPC